jgi:predicted transcriptional regulator
MTEKAALRKKQTSVTKKLHAKFGASSIKFDDNYFMPKVTKSRSDGATLMDVYESKKADTWGRIIKSQFLEDEANKVKVYQDKIKANEDFGKKLRAQLDDNHKRFLSQMGKDDYLRDIVEASSKANDDIQRKKREDAKARDILFMDLAQKDVAIKKKKREI